MSVFTPQAQGDSSTTEVVKTNKSNTPTRVTEVKRRTTVFRPPLRRLSGSTSSSSSKLLAAFKSPLRVPNSSKTTTSDTSATAAEHTDLFEKDKTRLKATPPSHKLLTSSTRHTPYRLTSTLPRYDASSRNETEGEMHINESAESIAEEIEHLKDQLKNIDSEISELSHDYHEDELQQFIDHLHEYNEIKDVGQLLLGKLAEVQGTTTAQLYHQFDLNLDD